MNNEISEPPIITVQVKCMDSSTHSLSVPRTSTVAFVKSELSTRFDIPVALIRLIFRGRVLKDSETLDSYGVKDGYAIHMVSSSPPPAPPVEEPEPTREVLSQFNLLTSLLDAISNLRNRSSRLQFQPNAQRRLETVEHHKGKFMETFQQNVKQIEDLLKCRTTEKDKYYAGAMRAFDFKKINYQIGQWVDVKDAMGNWLEAQITDFREDKLYVHYNGWGTAWDEWIECNSPRVALFRSRTVQSPESIFHSFTPQIPPDSNSFTRPASFETLLGKFTGCTETLQQMLKSFSNPNEKKLLSAQVAPVLDRVGRVMLDLSQHFSTMAYEEHCTGTEVLRMSRFPENNGLGVECQIGLPPNPSEIFGLRDGQRQRDPAREVHVHQIIISRNESTAAENSALEVPTSVNGPEPVLNNVSSQVINNPENTSESTPLLDCNEVLSERLSMGRGNEPEMELGEDISELFNEPDDDKENVG